MGRGGPPNPTCRSGIVRFKGALQSRYKVMKSCRSWVRGPPKEADLTSRSKSSPYLLCDQRQTLAVLFYLFDLSNESDPCAAYSTNIVEGETINMKIH